MYNTPPKLGQVNKVYAILPRELVNSMIKRIYREYSKQVNYVITGAWNTIFAYGAFVILYYLLEKYKLHIFITLMLSQILGLTQAYVTYKFFVFKTKGHYLKEYLRFYVVYGSTFLVNLILIYIFVKVLLLNPILSQGIIAIIVVVLGYLGHNNYSFSNLFDKDQTV